MATHTMTGRDRWDASWAELGLRPPAGGYEDLQHRYSEETRAYHTLEHVDECLATFEGVRSRVESPALVELAIWYHDAIYVARRHDNEERSADLFADALKEQGAPEETSQRARELVLATKHGEHEPENEDARVLVDVDLAILGAETPRFDAYEAQIRKEYRCVPGVLYRPARRRILSGFLARDTIYSTPELHARLETRARANLRRSLGLGTDDPVY